MGADQDGYSVSAKSGHITATYHTIRRFPGIWCPLFPFTPAQHSYTFGYPFSGPFAARTRLVDTSILVHKNQGKTQNSFLNDLHMCVFQMQISFSHVTIPSPQLAPPMCRYAYLPALSCTRYVLGSMHLTLHAHSTYTVPTSTASSFANGGRNIKKSEPYMLSKP